MLKKYFLFYILKNFIFYEKLLFKLFLLVLSSASISQNVGISDSLTTPHASAILEIRSTNKGLLIPRIALTQTTMSSPII